MEAQAHTLHILLIKTDTTPGGAGRTRMSKSGISRVAEVRRLQPQATFLPWPY